MKDLFSEGAEEYAQFRPKYPEEFYKHLYTHLSHYKAAWDVGTGNGQVAGELAKRFGVVLATDISDQQLAAAERKFNVEYRKQAAEQPFSVELPFDLIITAQAIHWFDFTAFYKQVKRHLAPNGVFAAVGYGLISCGDAKLNAAIQHLYFELLHEFWDPERAYIDSAYADIPFPFNEIELPKTVIQESWTPARLCAYLSTWSAVSHYQKEKGTNPLAEIVALAETYPHELAFTCSFPVFQRVGTLS
jgi:SAM-dependent methyltransferase